MFARLKQASGRLTAALLIAVLIASALPVWPRDARAMTKGSGSGLKVSTEFGYGGVVSDGRWNPLKVTLTSERDLSGDLVIQVAPQNGMGESTYVRRVELPAGTSKEVTLAIPGGSYSRNTSLIRFYPKSVDSGKPLEFEEGSANLSSSAQYGGIVGVLASDPDTMNFLSLLQGSGQQIAIAPLEAGEIGDNPSLLEGLDVLVINNFASDSLSDNQRAAIASWVSGGGTLLLAGGADYAKTASGFEELSPVETTGSSRSVSAAVLESAGGGKPLSAQASVTAAEAAIKTGARAVYQADGTPLIASMPMQSGTVWYAGYDLALEPLASWAGSAQLWGRLLQSELNATAAGNVNPYGQAFNFGYSNLSYALDYFPSLHMPEMSLLLWMLLIYVVVVAPVLYLILRKMDKREWAWVCIPLVAIVSSAAIYFTGSSDKTSEVAHTLSYVELDGSGSGTRRSASALFVPRSGDYTVSLPRSAMVSAMYENSWIGGGNGTVSGEINNFIRDEQDRTELRLNSMSYWSVAKFVVEEPDSLKTGSLGTDLSMDAKGAVSGSVVNDTDRTLDAAALIAGNKLYQLGKLEPGARASVGKGTNLSSGYYDIGSLLFPISNASNDPYARQRAMAQNIQSANTTSTGAQNAFLIAFSEDSDDKLRVESKDVVNERLSLYTQAARINLLQSGEINIPYGYVAGAVIHTNTTQVSDDGMGRLSASPGRMTLGYTLPDVGDASYRTLGIRFREGVPQTVSTEIWNEAAGEWQAINWKNGSASVKKASDYIMEDGLIQIQVQVNEWTNMAMPEITLKGTVKP
ncbi:hypothetical protein QWJ34_02625 [Saccharibacillus sp. CPCC 101409]|uniref:DUF7408 domain-containing protein n=1 Tax=Saccharibacillus sp. CPCC 101409 TaxID=3058041 RepID=UPI002671187B|nr:hypothetical protein [Saccharibacillus sp. CPCC 101409]MDO3408653.1 hypothetical protein [Saccharibacillus sp. CPCC 101409]